MKQGVVVLVLALTATGCASVMGPGMYPPYGRSLVPPHASTGFGAAGPPVGRWDAVMRVPAMAVIDVLTQDGAAIIGPKLSADGQSLAVQIAGAEVRVARNDILRIDLVDLPGSEAGAMAKGIGRGALLGAGAAALFGAVLGGEAWPPPGRLMRAGAALGGLSGGQAAAVARQGRIIYLAESQASRSAVRGPKP